METNGQGDRKRQSRVQLEDDIDAVLLCLAGKKVIASHSSQGFERNGWFPQISVEGVLETTKPDDGPREYRIIATRSTYVYFTGAQVMALIEGLDCGTVIALDIKQQQANFPGEANDSGAKSEHPKH